MNTSPNVTAAKPLLAMGLRRSANCPFVPFSASATASSTSVGNASLSAKLSVLASFTQQSQSTVLLRRYAVAVNSNVISNYCGIAGSSIGSSSSGSGSSGGGSRCSICAFPFGSCSNPLRSSVRGFADRPATFSEIAEALKVLEVDININEKDLKKKYHSLVKKHHPDTGGDEKQMSKISVAYERLSKLSTKDKEGFELQKKGYSSSSGHSGRGGFQSSRGGSGAYRRPYEDNANFHRQQEYARQAAQARGSGGFYNFRNAQQAAGTAGPDPFAQNPFASRHPFSMGSHFRQFGRMSVHSIILRGLLIYFMMSFLAATLYRSYRDYANDDGWKMAESLSRHEQLAELHRIRQEMKDRLANTDRAREEAYVKEGLGTFSGPFRRLSSTNADAERIKELRALEYAQRRQMDLEMQAKEMRGWPKFDPSKGALMKLEDDVYGVVRFEPRAPSMVEINGVPTLVTKDPLPVPLGPSNDPSKGLMASSASILERAMQEQQRQQAEFVAAQQAKLQQQQQEYQQKQQQQQHQQQQQQTKSSESGSFSFQEVFKPPHPSKPV